MTTRTIITLTTIPPRFGSIAPTLQSLCDQDADIARIILFIPRTYRKRAFQKAELPALPDKVEVVQCEQDYGPATKVLPALTQFHGQDVRIIYCDDDRIYQTNWASRLIALNDKMPGTCIADVGDPVRVVDLRAAWDLPRNHRLNAWSLGLFGKPHRRHVRSLIPKSGPVDIAKGYGGVLIRPDFLDHAALAIPEAFWPVDDIWLSGHIARRGLTVYKSGAVPRSSSLRSAKSFALVDLELDGNGRDKLNLACVEYFRRTYGIWGGNDQPTSSV